MAKNTTQVPTYDDRIVRYFIIATLLWGAVGMLAGVLLALQLAWWPANGGLPYITFGRLRPIHTNAVIFAFAGNAVFAAIYYSTQRLCRARMFSSLLSYFHFWGWQAIIVAAAVTLALGISQSKEYAELEWPIDIAITLVWVALTVNLFGTIIKRREKHIYVAIWFYIATVLTVALLHIVNSLELPVSAFKSYPVFAGMNDALVQWWYGHNAVAFFLTTPFLGLMYYFLPKAAGRPVFSYRLSIIHFWSLVFLYIWAGPHHLLNTSLPQWAQTAGMLFSLMLIAPSWGGMINGLLTLRGAWDKLREDAILKFFVVGITFYGMSTLEGPLMSIRSVNALSHYTDWTIAHVHAGALGWNGFLTFGMIYWLIPRLWKVEVYSQKLMRLHFWIATVGILLYIISMWTAGVTQGLMWRAMNENGSLKYPEFIETVVRLRPFYWTRLLGGCMYIAGLFLMIYNVYKSVAASRKAFPVLEEVEIYIPAGSGVAAAATKVGPLSWFNTLHHALESKPLVFGVLSLIAVLVGTLVELVPMISHDVSKGSKIHVVPYTPLELEGRDLYIREGCYNCHSQMIRPFKDELVRYGEYSRIEEFVYDRPFQFGSRRIGPDLQRQGGKYTNFWHFNHMKDPRSTSPGSIMPVYTWLYENDLDTSLTVTKLRAMKTLGVPYTDADIQGAIANLHKQAEAIGADLTAQGVAQGNAMATKEIVAMIAYMQKLGTDYTRSMSVAKQETQNQGGTNGTTR